MTDGGGSLVLSSHENWRGPGHNSVLHTRTGDYLALHSYDAREVNGARNLQIRPLLWEASGWPLAGEPVEARQTRAPAKPATPPGRWKHWLNYDSPQEIELMADGSIRGGDGGKWQADDGMLELRWPNAEAPGGLWIDRCILAPDGRSYVGRNQTGMVIRGVRP